MQLHTGQRLTVYVAGASPNSGNAIRAVASLLRDPEYNYDLHVVDVHRSPGAAYRDGILTVPSVVLTRAGLKVVVGGVIDEQNVRARLGAVK
jgi:hypothetical protein